jgi:hypothetical protein
MGYALHQFILEVIYIITICRNVWCIDKIHDQFGDRAMIQKVAGHNQALRKLQRRYLVTAAPLCIDDRLHTNHLCCREQQ